MIDSDRLQWAIADVQLQRRLPPPARRRQLRYRAGVSQQAVAVALGVTRAAAGRYENGERTPRGAVLRAYVEILDHLAEALPRNVHDAAAKRRRAEVADEPRQEQE